MEEFFRQGGADDAQATVMARQLLKRASQLMVERDLGDLEAVEYLLKKIVEARNV